MTCTENNRNYECHIETNDTGDSPESQFGTVRVSQERLKNNFDDIK